MTERKPPGVSWESFVEKQIREAQERGEFDDLSCAGQPLTDLNGYHDEMWWIRQKLRREEISYLPPTLAVRKERDDALERIAAAKTETEVRAIVADINTKIVELNRKPTGGPPTSLMPLNVDRVVRDWKQRAARRQAGN
jgi:Domain of unknown function (DUF1992)